MAQITTRLVAVATTASSPSPPTRNLRAASPRSSSTTTKTTTSPREYCGLSSNPSRLRPLRRRRRVAATPFALFGVGAASKTAPPSSSEIVPGQGAGSPKWPEIYDAIASDALRVRTIEASDLRSFLASREGARATLVDVRQAIEHDEWRLAGSINVPYAIPDPFWPRRVVGYAISIKGGLKGAFYTLVPIRPRRRGERRSLRTLPGASLRPGSLALDPRPRRLSTPKSDAFQLHPDIIASYGTAQSSQPAVRRGRRRRRVRRRREPSRR